MTQCSAVDYTDVTVLVFPFGSCVSFLADLLGSPASDFTIIAIAEFLGIIGFTTVKAKSYEGRLLAYAGDNANVLTWIMHRKPRNRIARYLVSVLSRLEAHHGFVVFPCYISALNNVW